MKTASAIILLFLCFQGIAQNIATIQLGVEDGLPSSQVYNIIQDDYGYIWFSTDRGLSRYNGYEFENYENIHGLAENVVFDFVKTNDGSIWCTTISSQVFKISGREPTFTLYPYNATVKKNSENNITKGLYFSPSGDLYLSFHHRYGYLHLSSTGQVKSTPEFGNPNATERYCKVLKDDNSEPFF